MCSIDRTICWYITVPKFENSVSKNLRNDRDSEFSNVAVRKCPLMAQSCRVGERPVTSAFRGKTDSFSAHRKCQKMIRLEDYRIR